MRKQFIKYWIRPYGLSNTARDLAEELGGRTLKLEGSRYKKKNGHVLINWGGTGALDGIDLNRQEAVSIAVSKMQTFRVLQAAGIPIPEWTKIAEDARRWLKVDKVVGRDSDNGKGGKGITVYRNGDEIGNHLFYTKYFKKEREFRIHVFGDRVIFEQEKKRKSGVENDKYIRSYDRGWCFTYKQLGNNPIPDIVRTSAVQAIQAIGLHFGAVDCGWNTDGGTCVFEVNTAPGLEGSSLKAYANAIQQL